MRYIENRRKQKDKSFLQFLSGKSNKIDLKIGVRQPQLSLKLNPAIIGSDLDFLLVFKIVRGWFPLQVADERLPSPAKNGLFFWKLIWLNKILHPQVCHKWMLLSLFEDLDLILIIFMCYFSPWSMEKRWKEVEVESSIYKHRRGRQDAIQLWQQIRNLFYEFYSYYLVWCFPAKCLSTTKTSPSQIKNELQISRWGCFYTMPNPLKAYTLTKSNLS